MSDPVERGQRMRAEICRFVPAFTTEHGYPPTITEIAAHLQISVRSTHRHVHRLLDEGRLSVGPGPRTLRVVT